jgi:hypothetical protein
LVGLAAIQVLPRMEKLEGYVANFGKEGLGLYVRQPLDKGDHVHIDLSVEAGGELAVEEHYQGNVAWVNQVGGVYAVGIQFIDEKGGCPHQSA